MRRDRRDRELRAILQRVTAVGDDAPSLDQKVNLAQLARSGSEESSRRVDEVILGELTRLREGLLEASRRQEALAALLEEVTAPPLHLGTYLGIGETKGGETAIVAHGGSRLAVGIAPDFDVGALEVGDDVLLSHELNLLVGLSPRPVTRSGETALFDRQCGDGRMVLRWRDEEVVVEPTDALRCEELKSGDRVRWDRGLWLAFEKVERATGDAFFLEETPSETFDDVGGLDSRIEALQRSIRLHRDHADIVRRYRLRRNGSVLLVGPPGTGKTLVARALARWLADRSASGRSRFMNIKPGGLHSVWYSQSEANYREAFQVAREAGEAEPEVPVVLFFDEVDAIGAARGRALSGVDDRVLTAFMTELDGLEARGNVLVVAATNRREALDPALLRPGRLGDLVLEIPRPGRDAARQILGIHLRPEIPYALDRERLIEAMLSRIYAPNAGTALAELTLRDGRKRTVGERDLVSGAILAGVARKAVERACLREVESDRPGLRLEDALAAIEGEFLAAAGALSPANCHRHLEGLPQDVDVVRVEPTERRGRRVHDYLSVA